MYLLKKINLNKLVFFRLNVSCPSIIYSLLMNMIKRQKGVRYPGLSMIQVQMRGRIMIRILRFYKGSNSTVVPCRPQLLFFKDWGI